MHDQVAGAGERTSGPDVAHEVAEDHGGHDGQTAHRRRARLHAVGGRAVLADVLADAPAAQRAHQQRRGRGWPPSKATPPDSMRESTGQDSAHGPRPSRTRRATSTSSKGTLAPASPGSVSWPLPASTTTSPAPAPPDGQGDGRPAVGLDDEPRPDVMAAGSTPERTSSMMARRVLAARVVRGDDGEVGQPGRHAPMTGRLARSRSPPQPKTTSTRAPGPASRRTLGQHQARGRPGCGRSRRGP